MPSTTLTTYRVDYGSGDIEYIVDDDRAEQLSQLGYRVTAIIEKAGF